jgi:Na+/melibiose symporter-like transporter
LKLKLELELTNQKFSFYNIGWNALTYTYMVELFPYAQRSKGIAFEQLTVRIANFFNTYVNPIGMDSIGWKYYIFYCVWMIVEISTVYFLFPETHNRTLEELSFMFEGKEKQDQVKKGMEMQLQSEDAEGQGKDSEKVVVAAKEVV